MKYGPFWEKGCSVSLDCINSVLFCAIQDLLRSPLFSYSQGHKNKRKLFLPVAFSKVGKQQLNREEFRNRRHFPSKTAICTLKLFLWCQLYALKVSWNVSFDQNVQVVGQICIRERKRVCSSDRKKLDSFSSKSALEPLIGMTLYIPAVWNC